MWVPRECANENKSLIIMTYGIRFTSHFSTILITIYVYFSWKLWQESLSYNVLYTFSDYRCIAVEVISRLIYIAYVKWPSAIVYCIIYLKITILVFYAAHCPLITSLDSKETILKKTELNEAEQKQKRKEYELLFEMFDVWRWLEYQ